MIVLLLFLPEEIRHLMQTTIAAPWKAGKRPVCVQKTDRDSGECSGKEERGKQSGSKNVGAEAKDW